MQSLTDQSSASIRWINSKRTKKKLKKIITNVLCDLAAGDGATHSADVGKRSNIKNCDDQINQELRKHHRNSIQLFKKEARVTTLGGQRPRSWMMASVKELEVNHQNKIPAVILIKFEV